MWCKRCQQDHPGVAAEDGAVRCAQCSSILRHGCGERSLPAGNPERDGEESRFRPPLDDWRDEMAIHEAHFALARAAPYLARAARLTSPDDNSQDLEIDSAAASSRPDPEASVRGGAFAWLILLVGTAALVCGGVLCGWSMFGARPHLWDLGLPILLAGQAIVLVGIVLKVERGSARRETHSSPAGPRHDVLSRSDRRPLSLGRSQ